MIDADNLKTTRRPGSFRCTGALLLLWAGAIAWGVLPIPQAVAAPHAELRETAFDFGKIYEDRALTHTFVIKNTGTSTLNYRGCGPGLRLHRAQLR